MTDKRREESKPKRNYKVNLKSDDFYRSEDFYKWLEDEFSIKSSGITAEIKPKIEILWKDIIKKANEINDLDYAIIIRKVFYCSEETDEIKKLKAEQENLKDDIRSNYRTILDLTKSEGIKQQ